MALSQYKFTLQQEKQSSYQRIDLLVVLLHLITFIVYAVSIYPNGAMGAYMGIVAAIIYLTLFSLNKSKPFTTIILPLPLFVFALFWISTGVYWMGILVFLFATFALVSRKKIIVIFEQQNIVYQSFPKRTFNWNSLNNVILKDGMLTIDFKNNKIIQQLIEEKNIDETAFNQFCLYQLQIADTSPQTS